MAALRKDIEQFLITSPITLIDESTFTDFTFQVGSTPLTHIMYPITVIGCYCIGIPLLQRFMKGRSSPPLKFILIVHNIFLSLISGALLLFLCSTLWSFVEDKDYGYFTVYCRLNYEDQKGTLTFIYYVNYLLKYYELLDTVFLALKQKPIGFLHAYHHPATLVLVCCFYKIWNFK